MTYFGTALALEYAYVIVQISKAGPFFFYPATLAFIIVCLFFYPTETGFYAIGVLGSEIAEKILWTAVATVVYGLNSFLSIWLSPNVREYWFEIKAEEEAVQAAKDAKR